MNKLLARAVSRLPVRFADSAIFKLVTGAGGTDFNIASSFGLAVEKKCAWTKSIIFLEVGIYDMKRI